MACTSVGPRRTTRGKFLLQLIKCRWFAITTFFFVSNLKLWCGVDSFTFQNLVVRKAVSNRFRFRQHIICSWSLISQWHLIIKHMKILYAHVNVHAWIKYSLHRRRYEFHCVFIDRTTHKTGGNRADGKFYIQSRNKCKRCNCFAGYISFALLYVIYKGSKIDPLVVIPNYSSPMQYS